MIPIWKLIRQPYTLKKSSNSNYVSIIGHKFSLIVLGESLGKIIRIGKYTLIDVFNIEEVVITLLFQVSLLVIDRRIVFIPLFSLARLTFCILIMDKKCAFWFLLDVVVRVDLYRLPCQQMWLHRWRMLPVFVAQAR